MSNNTVYYHIKKDILETILKTIQKGIQEDKEFANTKIKDADWEQFFEYFIKQKG